MDIQEIRYDASKRFEDVCNKALASGQQQEIVIRTKDFASQREEGYDSYEVTIVLERLKLRKNIMVETATIMDSKESKDIVWIRPAPVIVELKAEAKKL